jgi:hypothetical protein
MGPEHSLAVVAAHALASTPCRPTAPIAPGGRRGRGPRRLASRPPDALGRWLGAERPPRPRRDGSRRGLVVAGLGAPRGRRIPDVARGGAARSGRGRDRTAQRVRRPLARRRRAADATPRPRSRARSRARGSTGVGRSCTASPCSRPRHLPPPGRAAAALSLHFDAPDRSARGDRGGLWHSRSADGAYEVLVDDAAPARGRSDARARPAGGRSCRGYPRRAVLIGMRCRPAARHLSDDRGAGAERTGAAGASGRRLSPAAARAHGEPGVLFLSRIDRPGRSTHVRRPRSTSAAPAGA